MRTLRWEHKPTRGGGGYVSIRASSAAIMESRRPSRSHDPFRSFTGEALIRLSAWLFNTGLRYVVQDTPRGHALHAAR